MGRRHRLPGAKNGSGLLTHARNALVYTGYLFLGFMLLAFALAAGGGGGGGGGAGGAGGTPAASASDTPTVTPVAEAESQTTTMGPQTATPTSTPSQAETEYAVRVSYDGQWTGNIAAGGSSRSVEGEGTETIEITAENPSVISATVQKSMQGDSGNALTVEILRNGEVVKESTTTAAYGVASVSYSTPLFSVDVSAVDVRR